MKYRILHFSVGTWEALIKVVNVDAPYLSLTFSIANREMITEERLGIFVQEAMDKDREALKNLEMVLHAQRTGQVLST